MADASGASRVLAFERAAGPLVQRLRAGLEQLGLALRIEANRGVEELGLSPLQGQLLARIAGAREAPRLNDLAAACGVRPATASEATAALVAKRLVTRRRSARDGRSVELRPTPRGRALAARGAARRDGLERTLARLSAGEQEVLLGALAALVGDLVTAGQLPTQRICPGCRFFRRRAHPGSARPHHCAFADVAFADRAVRMDCAEFEPSPAV